MNLQSTVLNQREALTAMLGKPMRELARSCAAVMGDRDAVEKLLGAAIIKLANCKHLYALDAEGRQFINNITREGADISHYGRNRMDRPYMQGILGITDFKLSSGYISRNTKRPMITAVQVVRNEQGEHIGFIGADFDLRELPGIQGLYEEPQAWRQIKGDPVIRDGLFLQSRVQSRMDDQVDDILSLMTELMTEHGVFHGKLHFSSSRATIWLIDDPYAYRILSFEDLTDPDICLAYPHRPYTMRAVVAPEQIRPVFDMFRELRFADENVYLRAGSLNICNGMVGLNFSCDGSHYLRYDEFLDKGLEFWFGNLIPEK